MSVTLVIRFTNANTSGPNLQDLDIVVTEEQIKTVNSNFVKREIRNQNQYCSNKRLKLIYNGRVLNDKIDFQKDVINARRGQEDDSYSERIYIHCVVGEVLTKAQLNEENKLDNQERGPSTAPQAIGFDRLLQQGFSQQDINDLRLQFEQIYNLGGDQGNSQINDLEEEEARQHRLRMLEERWIELTVNPNGTGEGPGGPSPSGGANNQADNTAEEPMTHTLPPQQDLEEDHNIDLLLGLLIGVFLGTIGIVFIVGDDTVFSKPQKMAIIAGLFINFSIAIVRGQWI